MRTSSSARRPVPSAGAQITSGTPLAELVRRQIDGPGREIAGGSGRRSCCSIVLAGMLRHRQDDGEVPPAASARWRWPPTRSEAERFAVIDRRPAAVARVAGRDRCSSPPSTPRSGEFVVFDRAEWRPPGGRGRGELRRAGRLAVGDDRRPAVHGRWPAVGRQCRSRRRLRPVIVLAPITQRRRADAPRRCARSRTLRGRRRERRVGRAGQGGDRRDRLERARSGASRPVRRGRPRPGGFASSIRCARSGKV